jgi:predicted nucleic acid-binding Zn ribbon protein
MSKKAQNEFQSVGDAIQELLKTFHIKNKFDETTIVNLWPELVGKTIAKNTKKVVIRDKVLFVEFSSPSVKHNFSLYKSKVLEIFKEKFGAGILQEIVIM